MSSVAGTRTPILERDAELEACLALVRQAERREGAVALLEGPAGIGKTAVLHAVRDAARERGFAVLAATGSELDRDFPFGLVHQLLDGVLLGAGAERRETLLSGAAALAEVVLAPTGAAPSTDPTHAALHGLYWLCANLSEERPLLLVVDDLHWGDLASLRFVEFLGRRLEGLPLLVLGAARPGEAGPAEDLLGLVASGPSTRTISPAPLSEAAVGQALAAGLEEEPDAAFVSAGARATGGNPLLVRELARAAREQGLHGTAADAGAVAGLAAAGVAGSTRRRLATLGPAASNVAAAATVLGEAPRPDDLAALTGLPDAAVLEALDVLVRAEVLSGTGRGFVHPLVREALASSIPPAERSRLHAIAAQRLIARDAPPLQVAVHLLAAEPAAEPGVVEVLRRAAREAAAEGASDTAVAHLRRALLEPPAPEERAAVLLELGERRLAAGDADGVEDLTAALEAGLEGDEAARARMGRASISLLVDARSAVTELGTALAETTDPVLAARLEAVGLEASFYDARLADERADLLAGEPGVVPSPTLLAHRAVDAAYRAEPAEVVLASARGAIAEAALVRALGPASPTVNLLALALRHAEEPELAAGLLDAAEGEARRFGVMLSRWYLNHARAYWHLVFGTMTGAEAHAREALGIVATQPVGLARMAAAAILTEVLVERDRLDEASALLDEHPIPPGADGTVALPDYLAARATVRLAQRRPDEALADLKRAHEQLVARDWRVPLKGRVPLRLAEQLAASGDKAGALALLGEHEQLARARGAHGTTGIVLRARARIGTSAEAEGLLADAEAELRRSAMRLDLGWALLERGAAARRAGRRAEAREPLREALDLAGRLGAERLAALTREELLAAGARPQRAALKGPESLTPSERRVAELAASGLSNREVAETLWVTRKTVELHLGRSYAKLGIRSRAQLADALAG